VSTPSRIQPLLLLTAHSNPQRNTSEDLPQRSQEQQQQHQQQQQTQQPSSQQQTQQPSSQQQTQQSSQQQQTPSPRKSMFEFISPFDHLSTAVKKKPVPAQPPSGSTTADDSSWSAVTEPKHPSVENLLDHLSRQQPATAQPPPLPQPYETFDFSHQEPLPSRAPPPPLPPKPLPNRNASPRPSPKSQTQRTQARSADSPASQQGSSVSPNLRNKEVSPIPRAPAIRSKFNAPQSKFPKNQSSPRSASPSMTLYPSHILLVLRRSLSSSMFPSRWMIFKPLAIQSSRPR